MIPTRAQLMEIAGVARPAAAVAANMDSVIAGLSAYGVAAGLTAPHRLAHFLGQIAHESGGFRFDAEIWGPTPAQKGYDSRTDLGNTKELDGDGEKYKGRGPIQVTGKANYTAFRDWCAARRLNPPDFVASPELLNTDPWEGLAPIWYWDTRGLNHFADENNIEMLTKRINGGLNGLGDRIDRYVRAALVLLGYEPDAVHAFQVDAQQAGLLPADEPGKPSQVDGDAGPKTRTALHKMLAGRQAPELAVPVKSGPIVDEKPVPVVAKGADKRGWLAWPAGGIGLGTIVPAFFDLPLSAKLAIAGVIVLLLVTMLLLGERIIRRTKALIAEINA